MKGFAVALVGLAAANGPNASLGRDAGSAIVDLVKKGVLAARSGASYGSAVGESSWSQSSKGSGAGAAERHASFEGGCEINYGADCPDGWDHRNGECHATAAYGGACDFVQSFSGASEADKANFAQDCGAPWPCADASCPNGHNYDGCPSGWTAASNGVCRGDSNGGAGCNGAYRFSRMTVSQKRDLVLACGHSWPCKEPCF